jgi:HlyD family secretion protein
MLKDWFPQQTYDEIFAKYQGAQAQYIAVQAELDEAKKRPRIEQQTMARGQRKELLAHCRKQADQGAISLLPDMSIETITLNLGELALRDIPYLRVT